MAKKHVYSRSSQGFGDFIYVDLLPDVRRSRQFNMNVIIVLLFTISIGFLLIYMPYSDLIFELEDISGINNDLQHEFVLTNEEFVGYNIDLYAINFEDDITEISKLRVNFNNLVDDVELVVDLSNGRIDSVKYSATSEELYIEVSIVSQFSYSALNNQLLNLGWVSYSSYNTPVRFSGDVEYTALFTIGVDYNAE